MKVMKFKSLTILIQKNVLTKFVSRPKIQIWSTLQNIKKGQIKNPLHKSVYKHGYYGIGKYTARKNNVKTEEYIKWFSMFVRCYDKKYQSKQPTYIGCSVSNDFFKILQNGIHTINMRVNIH